MTSSKPWPVQADPHERSETETSVVRAELVLARSSALPLAEVALEPDPLQSFAVALSRTKAQRGEHAVVAIDLIPAAPYQRRRLRRRLLREAEQDQPSLASVLSEGQAGSGEDEYRADCAGGLRVERSHP